MRQVKLIHKKQVLQKFCKLSALLIVAISLTNKVYFTYVLYVHSLILILNIQMADHNVDEIKVEVHVFGEEEKLGTLEFWKDCTNTI